MAEKGANAKVDLVILNGDLTDHTGNPEGMIGPFKKKGLEVAVMPGNHESMAELGGAMDFYGAKNLHGYTIIKGDVGIFGCGYADVGPWQLREEEFFATLKRAHDSIKHLKKRIMITHIQPSDSILNVEMWPGSTGVRKAIEEFQPDMHLCGHIHETQGIEDKIGKTRIINVGKTGKIFEI